jgi:hypothetical protein
MRRDAVYHSKRIRRDLLLILISVISAIVIGHSNLLNWLLVGHYNISSLNSFVCGFFFTSLFTTPISIIALAHIAPTTNIYSMALYGACGAMVGDLVLFIFIKDKLAEDISYVLRAPYYKKFIAIFRHRIFRWLTPLVGAIVIASPLPDEVGIAIMGLSKMRTRLLIPISFAMNFIGILLIGLAATVF